MELLIKKKEKMRSESKESILVDKYGFVDKDPIDEGNCLSNFFIHWAFRIIRLSNLINIKPKHLGNLSHERSSKKYLEDIYFNWENRDYKNTFYCPLLWTSIRTNIKSISIISLFSSFL